MEVVRSLWLRVGPKVYPSSPTYTPLANLSGPSSSHSLNTFDHDTDDSVAPLDRRPIISWRTDPKFEVSINYRGLGRQIGLILFALLPSFTLSSRHKNTRKLFPTSYLDGLRGVAAFFVVVHHYVTAWMSGTFYGYGYNKKGEEPGKYDYFWYLPVFRVVHAGRFMVVIFFVISGYVLSYRSLKLARLGKHLELLESLSSSVFRRWIRLHLPVAASCLMAFLLGRLDVWNHMPKGWEHDPSGFSHLQAHPIPFPRPKGSFFHQLKDLYADLKVLCNPFLYGRQASSRYNVGPLWTIPIEFMGSMIVFVLVLGIARTHTWVKLGTISILLWYCHSTGRWEAATFLQGIFLAELSFIYARPLEPSTPPLNTEKSQSSSKYQKWKDLAYKAFFLSLFILSLHLGGQARAQWDKTPGYRWMHAHLPSAYAKSNDKAQNFWPSIAAFLLVFSLEMAPFLQSIFTTPLAQYLGETSFSLYMIHLQILFTLGEWLVPKCMDITGGWANGELGFAAGCIMACAVLLPLTFWVADVFSRCVDEKCVKFARWCSDRAFVKI